MSSCINVLITHHVSLLVMMIFDDKYHVESRENGGHEVDVVLSFRVIPATKHRVGGSQYRAARVQSGGDASLQVEAQVLIK